MTIFSRFANLFRKKYFVFRTGYSDLNSTSWADTPNEALEKVAYVYRSVVIITEKMASIPFIIEDGKGHTYDKVIANFKHGNPLFTWHEIIAMTQAQNELRGFAIWDLSDGFIKVLDSDLVTFVKNEDSVDILYFDPMKGIENKLDLSKIAIFRNFTPKPRLTGLSTISAAMGGVKLESLSEQLNIKLMINGAVVPVYIRTTQQLTEKQKIEIKKAWKERYSGVDNAGHTPVMPPGVEVQQLGLSPVDMGIISNIKAGQSQIATVFGVPSLFLNDLENTKYDSAEAQERVFTKYTIIPKCTAFADTINKQVLPILGILDYEFKFDFSGLPELQPDMVKKEQVYDIRIKNGSMTINERRKLAGEETVPWGDSWWGPLNITEIGTVKQSGKSFENAIKVLKSKKTDLIWKNFVARTTPEESKLAKELMKYWKKQEKFVLDYIHQQKSFKLPKSWNDVLAKLLKTYLIAFMQQAGDAQAAEFGISFDLQKPEIQRWLAAKVMTSAVEINTTTKKDVLKQLKEAVENGESIQDMDKRIKGLFEETYKHRAQTVARTEVISANNKAGLEAARQANMGHKVWITSLDERTRTFENGADFDHAKMDGVTVGIDEKFAVPSVFGDEYLDFPGDPSGSPGDIINCRCTMTYAP